MEVERLGDAAAFLEEAEPLLLRDEARHNLMLGIAGTLRDDPGIYAEHRLWLVRDGGEVVGAALRTPPLNLVVAEPAAGRAAGSRDVRGGVGDEDRLLPPDAHGAGCVCAPPRPARPRPRRRDANGDT